MTSTADKETTTISTVESRQLQHLKHRRKYSVATVYSAVLMMDEYCTGHGFVISMSIKYL